MFDFLTHLLDTTGFPPRWYCGDWTVGHGLLHIFSDLSVWLAYVAIPCVLGFFVLRRKDIPFRTGIPAVRGVHPGLRHDPPDGGNHLLVARLPLSGGPQAGNRHCLLEHGPGTRAGDSESPGDAQSRRTRA